MEQLATPRNKGVSLTADSPRQTHCPLIQPPLEGCLLVQRGKGENPLPSCVHTYTPNQKPDLIPHLKHLLHTKFSRRQDDASLLPCLSVSGVV